MRPVIILFAKAPAPGCVKTRLIPTLSPALAAMLHTAFVWDAIERLQALCGMADLELHTDICTDAWEAPGVSRALQGEGDLGLKMLQALRTALRAGRDQAMIIGTDAPTLPIEHVKRSSFTAVKGSVGLSKGTFDLRFVLYCFQDVVQNSR